MSCCLCNSSALPRAASTTSSIVSKLSSLLTAISMKYCIASSFSFSVMGTFLPSSVNCIVSKTFLIMLIDLAISGVVTFWKAFSISSVLSSSPVSFLFSSLAFVASLWLPASMAAPVATVPSLSTN